MIDAVASAFQIMEELARSDGPRGVTDLAASTGIPKARVHRHLTALCDLKYVEKLDNAPKYRATDRLFFLGQMTADNLPWLIATRTLLGLLRDKLKHSVVLSVIEDGHIRVMENYRGDAIVDISSRAGAILPLHASAQGKILLAYGGSGHLERCLQHPLERFTPKTIVNADQLKEEIRKVRSQGWASSDEEVELGFRIIAAPVFGSGDQLLFTIGIIGRVDNLVLSPDSPEVLAALSTSADLSKLMKSSRNKNS